MFCRKCFVSCHPIASGQDNQDEILQVLLNWGKIRTFLLTENPTPIRVVPARKWDHSGRHLGSTEKARRYLGFVAKVDLADGLRRTIDWTRQNLALIDACIQKQSEHMSRVQDVVTQLHA